MFFFALENGGVVAWNKMYKRDLVTHIRYPEGRSHEDIAVTHKFVFVAKRIVLLPDYLYHHVSRKNSISRTNTTTNRRDEYHSEMERFYDLMTYGYPEKNQTMIMCSASIWYLARTKPCKSDFYQKAAIIVDSIKKIPPNIPFKQRFVLAIWKLNKKLFYILAGLTGRLGKNK